MARIGQEEEQQLRRRCWSGAFWKTEEEVTVVCVPLNLSAVSRALHLFHVLIGLDPFDSLNNPVSVDPVVLLYGGGEQGPEC